MKRLKEIGSVAVFMLFMMSPAFLGIGLAAISGTPTGISSLGVFGPNATFTCEWKSEDGQQAIFTSSGGTRRFIDLDQRHVSVEIGKEYRVKSRMLHRWATQVYLVPA